ncbi:MAG: PAS domain S-box protein [Burkholderiales bacterium]
MFTFFRIDDARHAREDAEAWVRIIGANAEQNLNRFLGQAQATLARLAARPLVQALDPARCDPIVAEFVKLNPEYTTLGIRDLNGNIVCSFLTNPIPRLNTQDFPWFGEALKSDGFLVGDAFKGRQVGRWVSVLTHPVRDTEGRMIGLLAMPVDLLRLGESIFAAVPPNAIVAVTDRNNNIVLRSAEAAKYLGTSRPAAAQAASHGTRSGFVSTPGPDEVQRLYAYSTIDGLEWRVVTGLAESDVYANYRTRFVRNIAIGLATLIVALLLGWRLSRNIVRPVSVLASAASQVAAGKFGVRAELAGPTEVRTVAQQFNRALDARDDGEAVLRRSEQSLAVTLDSIGDGVIATDAAARITRMNPAAERLTGWPLAEVVGRPLSDVFRVYDARNGEPIVDPVAKALAAGAVVGLANHAALHSRDGTEYQIADSAAPIRDASGAIVGVVMVFADVSQQYAARQALATSEERLRNLLANLPGYAYRVANDPNYTPEYISEGVLGITGYAQREYLVERSISCGAEIHPEDREWVWNTVQEAIAAHLPFECEYRIVTKSGPTKWVWERGRGIYAPGGELLALEGFVTDIGARKAAEEARASLEAQLRESQKMEAIGTLAGGIAHDFNNIIGAVLGNVELARGDAGDNPRLQESLEEIRKAGERARAVVRQILSFSSRQGVERSPVSPGPLVSEVARLLRSALPARVLVETDIAADLPMILAEPTQVEQVLLNLALNASQAMPGRAGRIEISAAPVTLDAAAASALSSQLQPGDWVRLSVADDGDGMDAATVARIFEPFFTTKPVGEGTGLGLAVVHGIVRGHQGDILVTSTPGRGSRFDVYLPVSPVAAIPVPEAPRAQVQGSGAGHSVLYVDDDEALVSLVTRLLGRRGYQVTGFLKPEEALATLRADPGAFDLLVTDYNMPGLSGLDVARAARAIRPDLRIAVASGYVTEALRSDLAAIGVPDVILKANAVEDFCTVVQRLLDAPPG